MMYRGKKSLFVLRYTQNTQMQFGQNTEFLNVTAVVHKESLRLLKVNMPLHVVVRQKQVLLLLVLVFTCWSTCNNSSRRSHWNLVKIRQKLHFIFDNLKWF